VNSSGFACLVIVANLCLHTMADVSISDTTTSSWVIVKEQRFEAEIMLRSDSINTPDWSKMNTACAKGACISYFKHCQTDETMAECVYYFSQPGDIQNVSVRILSKNQDGIGEGEKDIGVLARTVAGTHEVPLRAFTKISGTPSPPYCGRGVPVRTCWPSQGR
jgi:hypothetical protein